MLHEEKKELEAKKKTKTHIPNKSDIVDILSQNVANIKKKRAAESIKNSMKSFLCVTNLASKRHFQMQTRVDGVQVIKIFVP